ncbi:hypothetical protein [Elizabethkingia bruuniana]|uniref:Uncharacterized protein n=1 Tax=Elizabethkingia bruuniana TaxID=1756149 RepID=A0A7T7ZYH9_9FLAO|nr:hypothetical protein [Elizabethkingia bruuniana]KGO09691.1 hypothetical protein KS04_13340 [Elizabethkingia miricola]AQX85742.1 hypothetical protein AYC65_12320 [Elizabethkingia bruuniana]KUY22843.1 hypothetical protein ATB97_11665 [Elizabethkingia bruuniana]OPB68712.1 hypothetical protein BAY12_00765 [Elizabethkingia bruuniana]QDZ61907.1 hypothetical protein EVD20_01875 [Elizabethkingia bruuniana]
MTINQKLPCPNCNANIIYNVQALIAGASFECQGCKAQIKISTSSIGEVKKAYENFTKLKSKISQK